MAEKSTPLPYDYSSFQDGPKAPDDILSKISTLADEMLALDRKIAEHDLEHKKLIEQRRQIAEEQLPELFEAVGMSELKTSKGIPLKLKNKVYTNIAKERKPKAIAWLDENGQGGMIRRNVVIEFDKTQQEKVDKLLKLIGRGWPNHRVQLDVNAATVKAFVKRCLEEGINVPKDIFGIHCVDVVEITSK